MNGLDLIIRYEQGELNSNEDYDSLADFVWATGLYKSTGSWGRFIEACFNNGWRPKA